jgi:predicted O-linked N-acetylglucosamine transferase (SPINDLY family)
MPLAALSSDIDPDAEIARARAELFGGAPQAAAARLSAVAEACPEHVVAAYFLAAARGASGDRAGFLAGLADARSRHARAQIVEVGGDLERMAREPDYAEQIAQAFYGAGHVAVAAEAYAHAAKGPAPSPQAMLGLGLSLQHQGRADDALAAFVRACEAYPQAPQLRSFLLYALFFVTDGVRRHAEEARRWAQTYARRPLPQDSAYPNPPLAGRKLRIGYVCPSVDSQLRQFLLPVLENHDRETTHVVMYVNAAPAAGLPCDELRVLGQASDEEVAQAIRRDRIDVLVDLWGHTAGGRLGVFALKPAPVQASWMNYVQTTGLDAIDYLLHPDCFDVPGSQAHCAETLRYIGPVISPFRPDPRPELSPAPALTNGFVTFASYNHPIRLNDATVAAWARILKGAADARLLLRYRYFEDEVLQNVTLMRFAAHGIEPHRIAFAGAVAQPHYYRSYAEVDLALDPAPCNGGTTSMDAIANGVPVLSLDGDDYYARTGVQVLEPLGLTDLIAPDWDAYVARAVGLASDIQGLDALRARVRAAFDASPRRDEAGFTRRLEAEFRDMFETWRRRRDGKG